MRASTGSSGAVRGSCRAGRSSKAASRRRPPHRTSACSIRRRRAGASPSRRGWAQSRPRIRTGSAAVPAGSKTKAECSRLSCGDQVSVSGTAGAAGDGVGGVSAGREGRGAGRLMPGRRFCCFMYLWLKRSGDRTREARKKGQPQRPDASRAAAPKIRPARRAARRGRGPRGPQDRR